MLNALQHVGQTLTRVGSPTLKANIIEVMAAVRLGAAT